jgi:transcriptional regulator with XRE-family HTH domain
MRTAGSEMAEADANPERDAYIMRALKEIGTTASTLRTLRGMSQQEVALIAGVVQGEVSKVESGRSTRLVTLARIAFALRVPLAVLLVSPPLEVGPSADTEPPTGSSKP